MSKLIKLLYLIDREALIMWGRLVTYDSFISMRYGPVISKTLDIICTSVEPGHDSYWYKYISEPEKYKISLIAEPPIDELSEAEVELISRIDHLYKSCDEWEMVRRTHALPEWVHPGDSVFDIKLSDILSQNGRTASEIKLIENELIALNEVETRLK